MKYLKDVITKKIFSFNTLEEIKKFSDEYENPNDLIDCNIFYSDGSGFNGRVSKICYGTEKHLRAKIFHREITNNEVEYMAFLEALKIAKIFDHVRADSQLVINQINKKWACNKEHLKVYLLHCRKLISSKSLTIEWINREKNFAGIKLDKIKGVEEIE